MTVGCAGCGNCCAPVYLSYPISGVLAWLRAPDPADDETWRSYWLGRGGWTDEMREMAIARWQPGSPTRQNAEFMAEHWTEEWTDADGSRVVTCSAYDPDTRLCTAHENRPPICSDYPWYGEPPKRKRALEKVADLGPGGARLGCSYIGDLPPEERPDRVRRLIPITPTNAAPRPRSSSPADIGS